MSDTLKPCPWCKSMTTLEFHGDNGWLIGCINDACDFMPSAWFDSENEAIESWENTRQSCWQEAAEIAEKLHDEYVEKEQFKWPEMRTEAATALGEIQAIFEAKSRGE